MASGGAGTKPTAWTPRDMAMGARALYLREV